jgi:hypothetical protein
MRRLIFPIAPLVITVALLAGCSSSGSSKISAATSPPTSTATSAPATTSTIPSLKEQVRRSWEGIQLDVIGSKPTPGFTTLFFQHNNWAAEISWNPPNTWCLLNTYTWHVTDAQSPTRFTVRYDRIHQYAACAPTPNDDTLIVKSVGTKQVVGRTVYNIKYTIAALKFPATRTVCSPVWNSTDRCGYKTPGVTLPTPPAA